MRAYMAKRVQVMYISVRCHVLGSVQCKLDWLYIPIYIYHSYVFWRTEELEDCTNKFNIVGEPYDSDVLT